MNDFDQNKKGVKKNKQKEVKCENLKSLAKLYGCDYRTLKKMLIVANKNQDFKRIKRNTLTPKEIRFIFKKLGKP